METLTPTTGAVDASAIEARVKKNIATFFNIDESEVQPSSRIVDDLHADSLDVVELLMDIEEDFDVQIPDEEADKISTVQQIIDYLVAHPKA